jgi:hypothetical protein
MPVARRIDEVVALLEAYALGEAAVPKKRIKAALKLLDLMMDDAPPPDGGNEAPALTDDQDVLVSPPRWFAA